jgi:cellobiose-specific phosphotransferase system component IIB
MNEILLVALSMALILSLGFSASLMIANAQSNSSQYDMKSVTDNINKSLAKLTGFTKHSCDNCQENRNWNCRRIEQYQWGSKTGDSF